MSTYPLSVGTPPSIDLCKSCACYHSLYEFLCTSVLLCLDDLVSWVSSISFCSSNHSASSSAWFPKPWRKGLDGDISFKTEYSIFCTLAIDLYISFTAEEASLMMAEQSLWVQQKIIRSDFIAMFLQQYSIIWFSPRTLGCLVLGSWPSNQWWVWVPSHSVSLKSNQILIGNSHKSCATIVLAHLAGRSSL